MSRSGTYGVGLERPLTRPGNTKLGPLFASFSMATDSCIGASKECEKYCYGKRGYYAYQTAIDALLRNSEAARRPGFESRMRHELALRPEPFFRIHVVGDFFSPEYVDIWRRLAKANPQKTFLTYTRSWTDPGILKALRKLGALPNVRLWYSYDRSMEIPPGDYPHAYMSVSDTDIPEEECLVFRTNRRTFVKKLGGFQVCPKEQGNPKMKSLTCSKCKLCLRRPDELFLVREDRQAELV